jgi:hypothetical protein
MAHFLFHFAFLVDDDVAGAHAGAFTDVIHSFL